MKEIRVSHGKSRIVDLPAELTSSDEIPIMIGCSEKSAGDIRQIVLNFSAVETMNSMGASKLVKLGAKLKRNGQKLSAYGVSVHYRDVLRLTALDKLIRIYDGEAEALAAIGSTSISSPADRSARSPSLPKARDEKHWAKHISKIMVPAMPSHSINLNVAGRRVVGPVEGFGPMWQKTYQLSLDTAVVVGAEKVQNAPPPFAQREIKFENGITGKPLTFQSATPRNFEEIIGEATLPSVKLDGHLFVPTGTEAQAVVILAPGSGGVSADHALKHAQVLLPVWLSMFSIRLRAGA